MINDYLPEDRDMHKIPRQWLINVAYTIVGEPFSTWVKAEIANRNEELAKKQNLLIDMDPEIARAFHGSVNISSKSNHPPDTCMMHVLIVCECFSYERQQCPSPEGRIEAAQNSGCDERAD